MTTLLKTTLTGLLVLASSTAFSADIAQGKAKAEAQCAACHANQGNWNNPIDGSYPKLAGQHKDYIEQALKQYRNGSRKNAIMGGQAANLTNDDISNLAAYLASLDGQLYLRK